MKSPLIGIVLGVTQLPLLALAQAHSNTASLSEVVVESSKLDKDLFTMTQAATVIEQADIERGAYTSVAEILRTVPGIEFKQVGGPGQYTYLRMRGFGAGYVLVVIDGVTMNMGSSGDVGNLIGQIDPSSVERIEILRGPQTVLYGANASAGVIAITTKRGTLNPQRSISVEAGSLGWKKAKASLQQVNNVGEGKLSTSLSLSKTDSNGLIQYEGYKDETLQASVDYKTKAWEAGAAVSRSNNTFKYSELKEVTRKNGTPTYWGQQFPDPHGYNDRETTTFSAYLAHKINNNLTQRLDYGWTESERKTEDQNNGLLGYVAAPWDGFSVDYATFYSAGSRVPIMDSGRTGTANNKDISNQINYSLRYADKGLKLMGGVELYEAKARQWGMWGNLTGRDQRRSFYSNGEYQFGTGLTVTGGLRHDNYDAWGGKTTGSIGANQKLGSATVYANFATTYGAPTISKLFDATSGNTALQPESGRTFEVGIRQSLAEYGLSWEATAWNSLINDVIIYDSSIANPRAYSGYGQYNNADKLRTRGLELSFAYAINPAWKLKGNYTYTLSDTKKVGKDYASTVLNARNKGSLGLSYQNGPLTVDTTVYAVQKRLDWTGVDWIPGYVRTDIAATYAVSRNVSLYARVENLFDVKRPEGLGYKPVGLYGVAGVTVRF